MEKLLVFISLAIFIILSFSNLIYLAVGRTPEEAIRLKEKGFFNLIFLLFKRVV